MEKLKIAKIVSTLTQPPIITIPLFLVICYVISLENGVLNFNKFVSCEIVALIFASLLPMVIILMWAKIINTDNDISNRQDRYVPLVVGIISYFIGVLISLFLNLDNFLTILLLCYSVNTGVVLLITIKWKISVHTTGISGPIAALILLLGPVGAVIALIYPIVIWSRVLLKKHTLAQAIAGGVQGFFLTVLEMYLFMNVLNMPIDGMISLEMSIFYILAIIAVPLILGILSYSGIKNKKTVFWISSIVILIAFIVLMPIEVTAIYVLITLTSILISLYAGEDFVWFMVLKSA
ncbi:MAG: hypothetical protein U0L42_04230 [Methanobrevibacter sp.]|uniref:hypothetical protein n=1 Tax=Methanobrevibacter sp. TaxID=66852 RepID=UPI002E78B03F|nr:hypothetical protein [Methanobrevibacter sp.]MEE0934860.1 hypothetical protein [Methanobrevibacter sp.]